MNLLMFLFLVHHAEESRNNCFKNDFLYDYSDGNRPIDFLHTHLNILRFVQ